MQRFIANCSKRHFLKCKYETAYNQASAIIESLYFDFCYSQLGIELLLLVYWMKQFHLYTSLVRLHCPRLKCFKRVLCRIFSENKINKCWLQMVFQGLFLYFGIVTKVHLRFLVSDQERYLCPFLSKCSEKFEHRKCTPKC